MLRFGLLMGPHGQSILVQTLVLDFLPTTEPEILPLGPRRISVRQRLTENDAYNDFYNLGKALSDTWSAEDSLVPGAMLAQFVTNIIEYLIKFGYGEFEYGKILY
jgi:hypothetical protein